MQYSGDMQTHHRCPEEPGYALTQKKKKTHKLSVVMHFRVRDRRMLV